ncbi:MmcQ/YjbR family DNA-binding protein [Streptococcus halotolerans]|uniref:MmcQ/YjbR family DNA-binding protein n=1 Tax=Streptococcus halotolerans TaxID=1814128 RepID=UPI000787E830|nr:MmcQ/YjbR family DNA-binding protein [Streptococcus halotolerans]
MSFESEFFKKKSVRFEQLEKFGFVKEAGAYVYREQFLDNQFQAVIRVTPDGAIFGQVLDVDLQEEYDAFRASTAQGNFIGQVREAYGQILTRIAEACFVMTLFQYDQTNRLAHYVTNTFGDKMDNPFAKFPGFTVFRHPDNSKWYGLIGTVTRGKLQVDSEKWSQKALHEEVEFINVKVDPNHLPELLKRSGIYPSYHMSKKTWITIVLDDSLSDEDLFHLVENSRALVAPTTLSNPNGPDYWVIPANPKYYNIDAEFSQSPEILWTQKASIKTGDWVLIYMTSPIKAIRYACKVLETNIDQKENEDKPQNKQLMKLSLKETFLDDQLPLELMVEKGVRAVRGPRRLSKDLVDYLEKEFSQFKAINPERTDSKS